MKKRRPEPIGNLLKQYLRYEQLDTPLYEHKMEYAWGEVMGPFVQKYTQQVFVKNQTLHVHLTSAVLRQELMMKRKDIIDRLNKHVGANVIFDIIFR